MSDTDFLQKKVNEISNRYYQKNESIPVDDFRFFINHLEGAIIQAYGVDKKITKKTGELGKGICMFPVFDRGHFQIDFFKHYKDETGDVIKREDTRVIPINSESKNKLLYGLHRMWDKKLDDLVKPEKNQQTTDLKYIG